MIYSPEEDSFLIKEEIKKYAKGRVLDVGTGSGILAEEAALYSEEVVAVDISKEAVDYCKEKIKTSKIKFFQSDLFSNVEGKFDLIIFNPPYLPEQEGEDRDTAQKVSGGKKGNEIIKRFFKDVAGFLEKEGKILILVSSLTPEVEQIMKDYEFKFKKISEQKMFFERIFVYVVEKIRK